MKIKIITTLLSIAFVAITMFGGCKKDNGAIPERVTVASVPAVSTNIVASGSQAIDLLNLAAFSGKFTVSVYFADAIPPSKVDIVVRKSNSTINNNNVKVYKIGVTTFPITYTITAAEIATLFGSPIALGDNYDFAPDIYVGDKKYEAFPIVGAGSGSGLSGMPNFKEFARFSALCAFDANIYKGNFVVINDVWADFSTGEVVPFTAISATQFSFIDPYVLNPTPIIVTVNPATNAVTIAKQQIGSSWGPTYSANPATYPNPWLSGTGTVAPCAKTITLTMTYGYRFGGVPSTEATFAGTYAFNLIKQ